MEIQNQMNPDPIKSNHIQKSTKKEIDDEVIGIIISINLMAEIFCRFYEDDEPSKTREDYV